MEIVYCVNDGQEDWIYTDIESALEHIKESVLDSAYPGEVYTITLARMTEAEIAALPVH
jgi:hypothetical protein